MALHIGKLIEKRLKETGMTKAEFARRISKTSQNVYDIFDRETIDTGLLLKISEVLTYDFFQHYSIAYSKLEGVNDTHSLHEIALKVDALTSDNEAKGTRIEQLEKENTYLTEINELLRSKVEDK